MKAKKTKSKPHDWLWESNEEKQKSDPLKTIRWSDPLKKIGSRKSANTIKIPDIQNKLFRVCIHKKAFFRLSSLVIDVSFVCEFKGSSRAPGGVE